MSQKELKKNQPLVSIILLYYNQPEYVKTALDSIMNQTYSNIELIFADDASEKINLTEIKKYINNTKKENIVNVKYCINEKNVGTVRNINNALKYCNGKYIKFFAADDELYDNDVVLHSVEAFENWKDPEVYMLANQCSMMDEKLDEELYLFINPAYGNDFNKFTAEEQYNAFMDSCIFAMGAVIIKAEMFEKFGYFNECYTYIEDWSYFLHLTRNGGKFGYLDFIGLKHRSGGISHYNECVKLPRHVLGFKNDMLLIQEHEIIPYLGNFSIQKQIKKIDKYLAEKTLFENIEEAENFQSCRLTYKELVKYVPAVMHRKKVWKVLNTIDAMSKKIISKVFHWYILAALIRLALLFSDVSLLGSELIASVANISIYLGTTSCIVAAFSWLIVHVYQFRLELKKILRGEN